MNEHFDEQLLDHIRCGRNDEAEAMLTEELAKKFIDSSVTGSLLHHAAQHNNAVIARRLIELGAYVDRFGGGSTTPLATAVFYERAAVVEVLLEAGAKIDIVEADDSSALQMGLDWLRVDLKSFNLLVRKLRTEASTSEQVAELLIKAGCNMFHASALRDVDVMECMLKRGVDVNSMDRTEKTALNVAVELQDVNVADWLVWNGIDVEAVDMDRTNVLTQAAERGYQDMVQFLLERGALPDGREETQDCSPLYATYWHFEETSYGGEPQKLFECAELLLQHGAGLGNADDIRDMFHSALYCSCDEAVKLLIAHLAMLEMLGQPVDKSVMRPMNGSYLTKMSELQKYYEPCQRVLAIEVFERFSLLDLVNGSDRKMRLLVRKETFLQEVEKVSTEHKLKELHSYYYNCMMRRIEKASRVVMLEDEAILVICKLFEANYNQFYNFAKGVVEYLNERDLENFVQV